MQSVSSRNWTRVAVSISYDDNDYTTGTSKFKLRMSKQEAIIIRTQIEYDICWMPINLLSMHFLFNDIFLFICFFVSVAVYEFLDICSITFHARLI